MALDLSGGAGAALPGTRILIWCSGVPVRVAGLEPWRRAVYSACRAGFERLLIVCAAPEQMRANLAGDPRLQGRRWEVVNEGEGWLERVARSGGRWVCLDDRWVVEGDHLRTLAASEGVSVAAGPGGPLAADAGDLVALAEAGWRPASSGTAAQRLLERPSLYVRVDSPSDAAAAESALLRSLGRNATGFLARHVDRPISRAISRRLAPYPVTPNQITLFSIGLGLLGAFCLLSPSYGFGLLGALLFLASTIVDGCDGEIARLKFQETAWGAKLDLLGDNLVHAFLFPCVALHVYFADPQGPYLLLGGVAMAGVLVSWLVVALVVVRGRPSSRLLAFFELFSNREFAYVLFVLALAGKLHWFVWAMAIGLWAFPAGLVGLRLLER
jgi:phosphatidylglycerophosphate synthase